MAYQLGCPAALVPRYLLQTALDLGQVESLALDLDGGLQDGLDLVQLVGVACDEVDQGSGGGGVGHLCCVLVYRGVNFLRKGGDGRW